MTTHLRVWRTGLVTALACAVLACRDSVGEGDTASPDGLYLLESIGGRSLPLDVVQTIGLTVTLLSDTLVLERGVSWEIPVARNRRPGVADSIVVAGRVAPRTYVALGERLVFADVGSGPDTATVKDGVLTAVSRFPPSTGCATPCVIVFRRR